MSFGANKSRQVGQRRFWSVPEFRRTGAIESKWNVNGHRGSHCLLYTNTNDTKHHGCGFATTRATSARHRPRLGQKTGSLVCVPVDRETDYNREKLLNTLCRRRNQSIAHYCGVCQSIKWSTFALIQTGGISCVSHNDSECESCLNGSSVVVIMPCR